MKYVATVREMGRGICRHWVDRWPRTTHTVTANTKKELEKKKKRVEKKIKKLNNSFDDMGVYLEEWKNKRYEKKKAKENKQ